MRDGVRIAGEGLVARWAARRTALARRATPLAALHDDERPPLLFVEGELLVDLDDAQTIALLRGRDGVVVEPHPDVPPAPEGMDPQKARSLDGMPRIATVRFDGRAIGDEPLRAVVRGTALEERDLSVTSPAGVGTLSLAAEIVREGGRVTPNAVGRSLALPPEASAEAPGISDGSNAYEWPEFKRHGFPRAWQLVDAYRQLKSMPSTPTIDVGILDGGFWIENGMPVAPPGRPPEFRAGVLQLNLGAEGQDAGGPNPAGDPTWHGQMVASLCAASHDDGAGVAGACGTVARPFLFKCDLSEEQVIRGVTYATAWGLDVMNMSFEINDPPPEFLWWGFDEDAFNKAFQWAADSGLAIVAGAGNSGKKLPDHDVRPATRTPGVITVGALNGGRAWVSPDGRASNYGDSVHVWAQGADVHVGPTPAFAHVSRASGTSGSAPLVAGVAAMLKLIDPALTGPQIRDLLMSTAAPGFPDPEVPDPKVTRVLDAGRAVWEAMGRRLPPGLGEPNDVPSSARPLTSEPDGTLVASSLGARGIARSGDVDWYVFAVEDFTMLTVDLRYAAGLARASVALLPDDPDSRAPEELGETTSRGHHRLGPTLVAPGTYRLKVTGGATVYELTAHVPSAPLPLDRFEVNDTPETATLFTLHRPGAGSPWLTDVHLGRRPGTYELTLHRASDVDYLHVTDVPAAHLLAPVVSIFRTDAPVDVALLGADGAVQAEWRGRRDAWIVLPEGEAWVRIAARTPTRYGMRLAIEADPRKVPRPWQEVPLSPFRDWWPDPPWELHGWERFLEVVIDPEVARTPGLRLSGHPGLTLHLLAQDGTPVVAAEPVGDGELHLSLADVRPGSYVVRVGRDLDPAARLAPGALRPAQFSLGPVL